MKHVFKPTIYDRLIRKEGKQQDAIIKLIKLANKERIIKK
jgi:hypothetical protein